MVYVAYLLTIPIMAAVDFLWLGVIAKGFVSARIGHLFAESVNWSAAGAFYFVFVAALYYFAILPARESASLFSAVTNGALLGAVAYATYDLTNMATLPGLPLSMTLVDIAWGAFVAGLVAGVGYALLSYLSA